MNPALTCRSHLHKTTLRTLVVVCALVVFGAAPAWSAQPAPASAPSDPVIDALKKCESLKCPAVQTLIGLKAGVWPRIKSGLAAPDEMTRFWSLGVLTEVPTLKAMDAVAALLLDAKPRIRAAAAYVLGAMKVKEVSPHLVKALSDKHLDVRFSAAMALGRVKDPNTVRPLIAATRDRDEEVRAYACLALGDIGLTSVVPTLLERLEQDAHPKVRGFAAMSLSKLSDKRGLPLLHARLKEETNAKAFAAAVFALGELGSTAELLALKRLEAALPKHPTKAIRLSGEVAEYISDAIDKLRATTFKPLGISIALPEGFKASPMADGVVPLTATDGGSGSVSRHPAGKAASALAGQAPTTLRFGEYKVLRQQTAAPDGSKQLAYYFDHKDGTLAVVFNVATNVDVKTLDRAARSVRFLEKGASP